MDTYVVQQKGRKQKRQWGGGIVYINIVKTGHKKMKNDASRDGKRRRRKGGKKKKKRTTRILILSFCVSIKMLRYIYTYYTSYIMYHRAVDGMLCRRLVGVCMYVYMLHRISAGYGNEMARRLGSSRRVGYSSRILWPEVLCVWTSFLLPIPEF